MTPPTCKSLFTFFIPDYWTPQQALAVMHREGLSYRLIGRNLGLSKNTVMQIVKRNAA